MYQVEWGEGESMTVDSHQLETFLQILVENGYSDFVVRNCLALGAR